MTTRSIAASPGPTKPAFSRKTERGDFRMSIRALSAVLIAALPALAGTVKGRITHAEDGSEAFKKETGQGGYVLRINIATEEGSVVTLNAVEGQTSVLEGGQPAALQGLHAGARVAAQVPEGCDLNGVSCVASEIDIQQPGGISRIEAQQVRDDAAKADAELNNPGAS